MTGVLREGMLLGMGNPLLDITANVNEELLNKYSLKPNDAILAEEKHMPLYKVLISDYHVEYTAGGATQNSLRVAQWILGVPKVAVLFGCVGLDKFGKILTKRALEDGVNVQYQYTDKQPTGTCAVLITKNGTQRSLCANLAAANCFTPDHIRKPENMSYVNNAEFYYVSGFFLTVSVESILEVAKVALKRNKLFMMNLSAPFLSQFFREQLMQTMPYVDIIFGNESEAAMFGKEQRFGTQDLHEIALNMTNLPKNNNRQRVAIITQGTLPVIVARNGTVKEFPVIELPMEKVIDTNGAGDAFVGGFLAQLVKGGTIEQAVKCGIWTATQIVQRNGCTFEGHANYTEY